MCVEMMRNRNDQNEIKKEKNALEHRNRTKANKINLFVKYCFIICVRLSVCSSIRWIVFFKLAVSLL